ncbi:transcriptional regulator, TetR family [Chitinophaga terrae (ex Kim and Jung 2007)]|jgi:AcrR family transcriptional regulator|uniref:Transcriptional regulator, TetR family n=2 Tax=Chitinophaga terrae (ex Kim and Jung 2007) TaxID=408074 RepID=A0A1H3Y2D4_9BACT|nr:TetR/AcrR family transcriptional regulator [Chitinophaga terrae (ex Kim and Jung 2007)]MDQ0108088.1 AcrR family transcriptional regulator [Chitinophaga terrae (ex Kim and Jung 2007)]GEP89506.1 TetR family transcriptional regulator [Chitinophaga terrae (ex Kim and Jung 2007)]SEA04958.1 transcriptional regulator, TetR family [Chitinophaga terrae (ex Kim and Jung 2007)]
MEVQERIMDKAFGLFRQFGTRSITMDDIAVKMGISKKTLYAHFTDKDDMVTQTISRFISIVEEECLADRERAKDAIEELFLVMEMLDRKLLNMNPVILLDLQKFHAKAWQVFVDYQNNMLATMIRENLERGISEGLYRPDLDIKILTQYRIHACMICFQPEVFSGAHDMSRVQKVLLENYLYGVASEKGYQLIEAYKKLSQNN